MKDVIAAAKLLASLSKDQREMAWAFAEELTGSGKVKNYTNGKRRGRPKGSKNKSKEEGEGESTNIDETFPKKDA